MVDELDETPTPDPENEPPVDAAALEPPAVDDDAAEATAPDDEEAYDGGTFSLSRNRFSGS
jgi:hypothetical protein